MGPALIQVGIAELEGLERRVRTLDCAVESALYADFSESPKVADAYGDWMGKWKNNRAEMTTAIEGIADTIRNIVDSFSQVDDDLAAQLTEGGGQ